MEMGQTSRETWHGVERQWQNEHGRSHIHMWWTEIERDTLGVSNHSLWPDYTAQGSSAGEIKTRGL